MLPRRHWGSHLGKCETQGEPLYPLWNFTLQGSSGASCVFGCNRPGPPQLSLAPVAVAVEDDKEGGVLVALERVREARAVLLHTRTRVSTRARTVAQRWICHHGAYVQSSRRVVARHTVALDAQKPLFVLAALRILRSDGYDLCSYPPSSSLCSKTQSLVKRKSNRAQRAMRQ